MMTLQGQPDEHYEHETLLVRRGRRSDVVSIVAVHSTVLGPALGGCRVWSYGTLEEACADALRLSAAMTLKAAVAGLPLGGGKSVIWLPPGAARPEGDFREAILHDFSESIEMLDGSYITAEDVGTNTDDMAFLSHWTDRAVLPQYLEVIRRAAGRRSSPGASRVLTHMEAT